MKPGLWVTRGPKMIPFDPAPMTSY